MMMAICLGMVLVSGISRVELGERGMREIA
jgi:hypothetical protein